MCGHGLMTALRKRKWWGSFFKGYDEKSGNETEGLLDPCLFMWFDDDMGNLWVVWFRFMLMIWFAVVH